MTSILQFMKNPRPKSTTDESSVSNEKSIRPKARNVRVQPANIVPANAGGEEGILLDKEHTTKVHPIITNEVRNSTPYDQDLIDASKDDSSSRPVENHVGCEGESESERKAFEDAPSWARLLYEEVKKQGSEFAPLKAQFTTFKAVAVVNQLLGEHEKSVEFMSEKFDGFELQLDDSKRDIHLLWGKIEDHDVKFAHLYDRIDDLERKSRRNFLLFVGIEERKDEDRDALVLDICNSELEVQVSLEDIERSHRLGARIHQQKEWCNNAEASQRRQQGHRPIIVKFNSCRKTQAVFVAKKLKGNRKAILENLTKERLRICNIAKETVGHRNVWTADGKIFAKCRDGSGLEPIIHGSVNV